MRPMGSVDGCVVVIWQIGRGVDLLGKSGPIGDGVFGHEEGECLCLSEFKFALKRMAILTGVGIL